MLLHFSHNDLDGIVSLLLSKELGVKNLFPCSYTSKSTYNIVKVFKSIISNENLIGKVKNILFTDINMTQDIYQEIKDNLPEYIPIDNVYLIDHHRDSEEFDIEFKHYIDPEYCAAKLYYNKLKDKNPKLLKYEDLIDAVDGYDSWKFDRSPFSVDLQRTFHYYIFNRPSYEKYHEKLFKYMELLKKDTPTNTYKPEWYKECLNNYYIHNKETVYKIVQECYNNDGIILVNLINKGAIIPSFDIQIHLMEKYPDSKYIIFLFGPQNNMVTFSLRTNIEENNSIDIGKLVMSYGGGGNLYAGSFSILNEATKIQETLNNIIKILNK